MVRSVFPWSVVAVPLKTTGVPPPHGPSQLVNSVADGDETASTSNHHLMGAKSVGGPFFGLCLRAWRCPIMRGKVESRDEMLILLEFDLFYAINEKAK
jgi:hypothetical protein